MGVEEQVNMGIDFNSFCQMLQDKFDDDPHLCQDTLNSEDIILKKFKALNDGTKRQFDGICKSLTICHVENPNIHDIKPKIYIFGVESGNAIILFFLNVILCLVVRELINLWSKWSTKIETDDEYLEKCSAVPIED